MLNESVSIYIESIDSEEQRTAAEEIRQFIHTIIPEVREAFKYKIPFFEYYGNLCYLGPQKGKLVLGFIKGAQLQARPGLLVAEDRKLIRHLVYENSADIDYELLAEILTEAAMLNEEAKK
jgi:hypothetical protein